MIDIKNLNNPVTFYEVEDSVNATDRPTDKEVESLVAIANGGDITIRQFAWALNRYQMDDDLIRRIVRAQGWLDRMGLQGREEICDDGVDIIDEGDNEWRCRKMGKDDILYAVTEKLPVDKMDRNHLDGVWDRYGVEKVVYSCLTLEKAKADLTALVMFTGKYARRGNVYVSEAGLIYSPGQMYANIPGGGIYAIKEM
ncbi:MAG: hypothetical protein EOM65_04900 [Synergistales bacterium]|nr:hypothetical protein [Synergistales bacterium]